MPRKVLVELRPALDGHAGIPQETRLLFSGLAGLPDVRAVGLLQSANLVLEPGLPMRRGAERPGLAADDRLNRLAKVVVSMHQGAMSHRLEAVRKRLLQYAGPMSAGAGALVGRKVPLTWFDPAPFKDFVWRSMFDKTLSAEELPAVTSAEFRVLRWPWAMLHAVGVGSGVLGHAIYPRLDTTGVDLLIAETPFPARVARPTRMVVRYHDAIPLLMPHTIKNRSYHRAMHFHALRRNVRDGAWFACVSDATRDDLLAVMPQLQERAVTIPNMISHHFAPEDAPPVRVPEILWSRKNREAPHGGGLEIGPEEAAAGPLSYLLMVSTLEPRKNHAALIDAWEMLRAQGHANLRLVCVGGLGWEHEALVARFEPWLARGGVHLLSNVPAADLRLLYRHAAVTVCPSFGEGFDFSGVEAMRSGGVVAASDIRVHRDVYRDAAEFFNPYAPKELAATLARLLDPAATGLRDGLRQRGALVSADYLPAKVMPQWERFLELVSR